MDTYVAVFFFGLGGWPWWAQRTTCAFGLPTTLRDVGSKEGDGAFKRRWLSEVRIREDPSVFGCWAKNELYMVFVKLQKGDFDT